jgi:hypothetical protein
MQYTFGGLFYTNFHSNDRCLKMSRRIAIFLFWLLGFAIGFMAYLSLPGVTAWFSSVLPTFLNHSMMGAIIAGVVGSALSTFTIVYWANRTA